MSRTRHRVSRALIVLLGVTLGLGVFFWVHKVRSTTAAPAAGAGEAIAQPKVATAAAVAPAPEPARPAVPPALVTQTPTPGAPANTAGGATAIASNLTTNANPGAAATVTPTTRPAPAGAGWANAAPGTISIQPYTGTAPLADAKARLDAGQHLAARRILNGALQANKLSGNDVAAAKTMLREINDTVVFSPKRFADDEFGGSYSVKPGNRLQSIAAEHDITWELLARINGLTDPRKMRAGQTLKLVKGPFHAVVDKSDFTLELYIGGTPGESTSTFVTSYRVGLGSDDSTPTGTWIVKGKLKNPTYFSPRGEGVIEADDPANPLGERWIALEGIDGHAVGKESYGIHGTIEPDSIGTQASMGCIRMLNEDVERVYELLVDGKSTVVVKE